MKHVLTDCSHHWLGLATAVASAVAVRFAGLGLHCGQGIVAMFE